MIRKFFEPRLNRLTYGCIALMAAMLLALMAWNGVAEGFRQQGSLIYYASIISESFGNIVVGAAYCAAAFLIVIVSLSLLRNFANLVRGRKEMPTMLGRSSVEGVFASAAKKVGEVVGILAPAFLFTIILSFALDSLNMVNKTRLIDLTFINMEKAIFGNYGFMIWTAAPYPIFFARFIILSFEGMSGILLAAAIAIAVARQHQLRHLAAAFCLCMLAMVPFWLVFPALSPQDRFIDNVYHLPMPAAIASAVSSFHPVLPIANFLAKIRSGKQTLVNLPTSTMPSAHTAWAVLVGFYLFRAKKWLGWIASPFLVGSTLGTVILAQHYFLDPIVGLIIAGLSIYITEKLAKRDEARI
jgi:hypothetical protein